MEKIRAGVDRQLAESKLNEICVRYLCEEAGEIVSLGGGAFGIVYRVKTKDGLCVIKSFRCEGMHRIQALETQTLAQYCPLPMPKTLFLHDADEQIPFDVMGMEYMNGVTACDVNPYMRSTRKRHACAERLIGALGEIHQAKGESFGLLTGDRHQDWVDFYRPIAQSVAQWVALNYQDRKHGISDSLARCIAWAWDHFDDIFFEPIDAPTLLHGDLNVCNFMIDRKTLLPTAVIDPWRSMWGDRDYDLHQLTNLTGNGYYLYNTYRANYRTAETCDLKCAFYALFNEIHCYMATQISYAFIYARMERNLRKQIKRFLSRTIG